MSTPQVNADSGEIMKETTVISHLEIDLSALEGAEWKKTNFEDSWSLNIVNSAPPGSPRHEESCTKRRRRSSGHCGGRRRRRHVEVAKSKESNAVDEFSLGGILRTLRSHPSLDLLHRLTICNVDDILPVHELCLLLTKAPKLHILMLEDITLYGEIGLQEYHSPYCTSLVQVFLSSCGPAEDMFVKWLLWHGNASLVELSLSEMLVSATTFDAVAQSPALRKLTLKSVPGLYQSHLLDNICNTTLSELHLLDPIQIRWFAEQLHWNLGRHLNTLTLVFYDTPQSSLQQMGQFVATSILARHASLQKLSLRFQRTYEAPYCCRGSWTDFTTALVPPLRYHERLQSLEVSFADNNGWDVTRRLDSSLETTLAEDNRVLSELVLTSPMHTLQVSPTAQFYLALNGAGRRKWDRVGPELLARSSQVFPNHQAHQLSMIFYLLSNHPTWIHSKEE